MKMITLLVGLVALSGCMSSNPQAVLCDGVNEPVERLLLQQITSTSAIVRWRGEADKVCIGRSATAMTTGIGATEDTGHKMAVITGLLPDTTYFYSVGGATTAPTRQTFQTAPRVGQLPEDGKLRFWLLGDSGTATEVTREGKPRYPGLAEAVRDGFVGYHNRTGGGAIAALLLLGDNAYPSGTDREWQGAFFDIYPEILGRTQTLPTIGNHEMGMAPYNLCVFVALPGCAEGPVNQPMGGVSMASDPMSYDGDGDGPDAEGFPYFNIFSLPTQAEMGGAPSGTEQYYSADIGNVRIVSLDSQLSTRDQGQMAAMKNWLVDSLSVGNPDWTIVIFHHPPYSKGENHDSDVEQREIDMRQTFAPVFEDYGVDVVYSGHAHSYERSWYLRGHYDASTTFDKDKHTLLDLNGEPALGSPAAPYPQTISGADDRAVYTVAGSSGKFNKLEPCAPGKRMGCTLPDWLMHPAHRTFEKLGDDYYPNGIARLGSVVIDATDRELTSTFIDMNGDVLDEFVITK